MVLFTLHHRFSYINTLTNPKKLLLQLKKNKKKFKITSKFVYQFLCGQEVCGQKWARNAFSKLEKKLKKKKKKLVRKLIEMEETNLEKVFKEFKDYANQASKGITNQEHDQNNIKPQKL